MDNMRYLRILKDADGAVWGELEVNGVPFVGVENRSKTGYDSLPAGIYSLEMSIKNTAPQIRCLRFIEVPGRTGAGNPFLIHRAKNNDWRTLEGCIAPGLSINQSAKSLLNDSEKAMDEIFRLLGDYVQGKRFTISIDNHAPGDAMSRKEFIERRTKGQST